MMWIKMDKASKGKAIDLQAVLILEKVVPLTRVNKATKRNRWEKRKAKMAAIL